MVLVAAILLFLAGLLHSWYGGNSRARIPSDVSLAFVFYRTYVCAIGIIFLLASLAILWIAKGFVWAIAGAIIYWIFLPMLTMPLLAALNLIPRYTVPWLRDRQREE